MSDVRPLKKSTSGTGLPRQFNSEDRAILKGLVYEGDTNFTSQKVGGFIFNTIPDCSSKPGFFTSGPNDGELEFMEIYEGATQTVGFRRARVDVAYDGSLNPTTETWKIYDPANGTTVVRTITVTHTWSGVDLTKSTEVTT